jgi:hypothetical protein
MKLKQLSIFLENAPGRLYEVTKAFGDLGINLRAHCICDTSHDFGVLRILVSDLATARGMIMDKYIPARVDEVVAAELEDTPGSLAEVLQLFLGNKVNVEYMYAVAGGKLGKAVMIFRFSDNDKAIEILQANGVKLLDAEGFGMVESQPSE